MVINVPTTPAEHLARAVRRHAAFRQAMCDTAAEVAEAKAHSDQGDTQGQGTPEEDRGR